MEDGSISVALTPIQLYAILNGKSISASELASNSWSEMPGPQRGLELRRFLQPMDLWSHSPAYTPSNAPARSSVVHYPHERNPDIAECAPAQSRPISRSTFNRAAAVLEIVGAGLEMGAGALLILAPEPTMVTKVAGGVMAVHGADYMQAAVRQLFSGRSVHDFTEQGTTWAARKAGASEQTAHRIGVVMDVSLGMADLGVGVYKAVGIRMGRMVLPEGEIITDAERVSLRKEEEFGGHTREKHVGRSADQLGERLAAEKNIPASSTWSSLRAAETIDTYTLKLNKVKIENWVRSPTRANLALRYEGSLKLGTGIVRKTGKMQEMVNAIVVLKKVKQGGKDYFIILTSYPDK